MTLPPFMAPRAVTMTPSPSKETMSPTAGAGSTSPRTLLKRRHESSIRHLEDPAEVPVVIPDALLKQHTLTEDQLLRMTQIQNALHRGYQQIAQKRRPQKRSFAETASNSKSSLTSRLMSAPRDSKMPRVESHPTFRNNLARAQFSGMLKSTSTPMLAKTTPEMVVIQGPASASLRTKSTMSSSPYSNTNPEDLLKSILHSKGYSTESVPSLSLENYFLKMTPENVAGYGSDVIQAVRQENISELQDMLHSGKTLQCCNRFGESIVHMACRRGSEKVLKFLLSKKVSIRLRDDYGRTPLHDACWTREPEFGLMAMLIKECPDLLLVSDKRGHTPLSYARRDHWGAWCEFLMEHSHLVCPKELGKCQ